MALVLLFAAGVLAFVVSMVTAGGAALLLIPVIHWTLGLSAVAPVLTVGTMTGGISRIVMLWPHIRWDIIRCYLLGALPGAFLGGWLFSTMVQSEDYAHWLRWIVGIFLISTIFQFRFGKRKKAFAMKVSWFTPIGFVVAVVSGIIGGTGPILNPFYLNLGVIKEELVVTKSCASLLVHLTKVSAYITFGALNQELLIAGLVLGVGAVVGNLIGRRFLAGMSSQVFRQAVLSMMVLSGVLLLLV